MDPQTAMPEWQGMLNDTGMAGLSFSDTLLDSPHVSTRAGLYVYLNPALHDRPSFEDSRVKTLLQVRYNEDIPSLISDLILASFDVLANSISRNESARSRTIIRSFITNKLPVFLSGNYASLIFEPLTSEHCIREALGRIDPSSSQSFDVLSDTRQDFLFACALHALIPESSIEEILGDVPMQGLPSGGRYSKDSLLSQFTANTAKIDQYVAELENMDGNAGAIAYAVIEFLHSLCASSDTMTLKVICNTLSRRPTTLDILMLFTPSDTLLRPLCQILDAWPENEDQQPVYDEFGGILLFVMAVRERFKMTTEEMGIENVNSFCAKYLRANSASRTLDNLSEHENEVFSSWIKGLFETEGISDEIMSACRPSEFLLLIATLFDQCLKACRAKVLAMDTMKAGFELFLEPFLLPSLIGGLNWFADQIWCLQPDSSSSVDNLMQALHVLLKPPRMSNESSLIHGAVLHVVSKRLSASLTHLQQLFPSRSDIKPLLNTIGPFVEDQDERSAIRELASWSLTPKAGLATALRNSVQSLIVWNATTAASTDATAPSSASKQIGNAVQILGAYRVIDVLIDELQRADFQDIALDVVSMMVVANWHKQPMDHTLNNGQKLHGLPMTLQSALQQRFEEADNLSLTDSNRASSVVRLHRRVEAFAGQMPITSAPSAGFMQSMSGAGAGAMPSSEIDNVLAEANMATAVDQSFLAGQDDLLGMG